MFTRGQWTWFWVIGLTVGIALLCGIVGGKKDEALLPQLALQGQKIYEAILSPTESPATVPIPPVGSRHQEEKIRLLERLEKTHGTYNSNHPRQRLLAALHGFHRYKQRSLDELNRVRDRYGKVTKAQKKIVESVIGYEASIEEAKRLIDKNDKVAQEIVDHALAFYGIGFSELSQYVKEVEGKGKSAERVSVSQALKHFVRDWAVEGEHERAATFPQILQSLQELFPNRSEENPVKVLVPGAGVGRIAHEIAALGGFEVTANEWSTYMNMAYRFLTSPANTSPFSTTIHPFIDWWSHQPTREELYRPISFPDVPVSSASVLLVEGDFTTAFSRPKDEGYFDAVVTLFFIDTARNLMSYMDTIHRLLKKPTAKQPGKDNYSNTRSDSGHWLNLGPLLYGSAPFVQFSLEEIIKLSEALGFEFLDTNPESGDLTLPGYKVRQKEAAYGFNKRALSKNAYWAQFWIARKGPK